MQGNKDATDENTILRKLPQAVAAAYQLPMFSSSHIIKLREQHLKGTPQYDMLSKAVVVSPGYRLAIQRPFPVAAEDCYSALVYPKDHARELGIRQNRIMVGGESAGGGLCAAEKFNHVFAYAKEHYFAENL